MANIVGLIGTGDAVPDVIVEALLGVPALLVGVTGGSKARKAKRVLAGLSWTRDPGGVVRAIAAAHAKAAGVAKRPRFGDIRLPVRRLEELVQAGCLSRAAALLDRTLAGGGVAEEGDGLRTSLERLFPAATDADRLPVQEGRDARGMELSKDDVVAGLEGLPRLSASGMSGWTYELLRDLAEEEPFVDRARELLNGLLAGKAGSPRVWCASRLVPLTKPGGGVRPICVMDAWVRLAGRIVAAKVATTLAEALAPLQFGVGVPGGVEVVAQAVALYDRVAAADESGALGVQTVDFVNAFNAVRRGAVWRGLEEFLPELLPFFRWGYGGATPLYLGSGAEVGECGSGVRQGDPLGPLLFCVGLHPVLRRVGERFPELFPLGYLDDVTMVGDRARLEEALAFFEREAGRVGLALNRVKSERFCRGDEEPRRGVDVLGTSVGCEEFVTERARARVDRALRSLDRIPELPPVIAFPLVQACVNARPTHVARTTVPWIAAPLLRVFDARVDAAIARIVGVRAGDLPEHARILRALPHRDGGTGVPRLGDAAEGAWTASVLHAARTLALLHPSLTTIISSTPFPNLLDTVRRLSPTHLCPGVGPVTGEGGGDGVGGAAGAAEAGVLGEGGEGAQGAGAAAAAGEPPAAGGDGVGAAAGPIVYWGPEGAATAGDLPAPKQRALNKPLVEAAKTRLAELFADDPAASAMVRSCAVTGGGAWFADGGCGRGGTRTPAGDFRFALAVRLLVPWAPDVAAVKCGLCPAVLRGTAALLHGLACPALSKIKLARHNAVRDALADFLRALHGRGAVSVEVPLGAVGRGGRGIVADVALNAGGVATYLDASVVDPACTKYLAARSSAEDGAAARAAEAAKEVKYRAGMAAAGVAGVRFVPFVLECGGRAGAKAEEFLDAECAAAGARAPAVTKNREFLMRRVRAAISRWNGAACLAFRRAATLLA